MLDNNNEPEQYVPNCSYATWDNLSRKSNNENLSFLCVNLRSIGSKFAEFTSYLAKLKWKFKFIAVTESWLTPDKDVALEIEGYKSKSIYRSGNRRGGGIKLYFLESINVNVIENLTFVEDNCEMLTIEASISRFGKILVSCVYYPSSTNSRFDPFCDKITQLLDFSVDKKAVVMGDFNLNLTRHPNSSDTTKYVELFTEYGFTNEITINTYVLPSNNESKSCIDHLWNNLKCTRESYVLMPNIADHFAISCVFSLYANNLQKLVRFRDYSQVNIDNFQRNADNEFSMLNIVYNNVETSTLQLINSMKKIQNKYFPIKTKIITNKRSTAPWLTNTLIKCIRKKDRWYKMVKRKIITYRCYRNYCSRLRSLLRQAEKRYYSSKLGRLGRDSKGNWKVLNRLLNRNIKNLTADGFMIDGNMVTDKRKISNEFCKFFSEKPHTIQNAIPRTSSDFSHLVPHNPNTMSLFPTNETEVYRAIMSLNKNGLIDDLSSKFLKLGSFWISYHLALLFNLCIERAIYPSIFKTARVTPVFKNKGSREQMNNYRPISIICNLSKIFEKLLNSRLLNFFKSQSILSQNQFGFRENSNTELAAISLINRILPALENKTYAICIFLDFTACFDTVDRLLLFRKLERCGVRGKCIEFIKSFFNNRKHFVEYGGCSSEIVPQLLGVIQGSRNGPFFYDVYSNDLNSICEGANIMFADDTCLVFVGDNLSSLADRVNSKLDEINRWCSYNKLAINPPKSEFLIITRVKYHSIPTISIGTDQIKHVRSVKYLGLMVDDDLKFKKHGKYLKGKLSAYSGISYKIRHFLDVHTAKKYYYAFVFSTITYCVTVWGGILHNTRFGDILSRLQEKIVNNLFGRFSVSRDVFSEFRLLKIKDVHKLYVSLYMFKLIKLDSCPSLRNCISLNYPSHSYSTRQRDQAQLPFPYIRALRISYNYQFIQIWNSLPNSARNCDRLSIFKKTVTDHLMNSYHSPVTTIS